MPDLEQAIAEWRQRMLAAGIQAPVPLDELESHLREETERQIQTGVNTQTAFENSVRQMGQAEALKDEFKNAGKSTWCAKRWKSMLRMGGIGLVCTLGLNVLGIYTFHRTPSVFFSHEWWTDWFTNYYLWTCFLTFGVAGWLAERRAQRKASRR